MGKRNVSGVRKETRGGKLHWVLDFRYTDKRGVRQRYRRDASVQSSAAAHAEAKRLMQRAAETGSVEEDDPGLPEKKSLTFREFAVGVFEAQFMPKFREGTRIRYRALLERQGVLAYFGDLRLDEVQGSHYRAFAAKLQTRGISPKGPLNMVRTVLRAAVEAGHLAEFPRLPALIRTSKKLPDAPSDDEIAAICGAATGWLKPAIFLAVFAGLRQGEVRALEVRDVDFAGDRLLVRRALSENAEVAPKSGHDRTVPLAPELRAVLEQAVRSKMPRARVVVREDGTTPTRQAFLHAFKAFLKKNGLRERSFHALRHGFCTTLIRRGASVEAVRVLAGHSNLQVTQRYVHAVAADLQAAIAKLGSSGR